MTAVTAVTAQNTKGVIQSFSIKPKDIEKQILYTCKDIKPDAIKIGMLQSSNIIETVAKNLDKINTYKIILDPVMVAKGGARLINKSAIKTLKNKLIKKTYLITPNIPEAEVLTNTKIKTLDDMIFASKLLLKLGAKNILLRAVIKKQKNSSLIFF